MSRVRRCCLAAAVPRIAERAERVGGIVLFTGESDEVRLSECGRAVGRYMESWEGGVVGKRAEGGLRFQVVR